ncbi:LpqB family beta-propeller domain-containing protein [Microbacterium timonense]|uniref:LpqB family beta-propeller domain-containing protein n=1 Tax=Microbacterium timonense TaxID=2086576 RepID=UPI000D10991B|nr:LpqB family beta-propeller domain-containing protein [Microbacterium timonense]
MTRARGILALLLALSAMIVTGCTGFPTSGPPEYGLESGGTGNGSQNVAFIPNRPQPGATPQQIVEGFIDAGSGPGVAGNWAVAREFLAPSLAKTWKPESSVTVDERAERDYVDTGDGTVDFAYDVVGTVDDKGSYQRAELAPGSTAFRLAKQSDGEWRITEAPDGIWLDEEQFPSVFRRYPLMYFDPSWEYLVPDVRWFPVTKAAGSIAGTLVNKPKSEWLADSVVTAFPDDVAAVPSVIVDDDGVAEVVLSETVLAASRTLQDRMLTQLEESLRAAGVSDVVMSVDSTPIDAQPVAVRSTRVPAAPLVLTEDGFGFLTGDEIDQIPGLSAAVQNAAPVSVQVGPERDLAAARTAAGQVVRLDSGGADPAVLDTRSGLVDPTIDRFGIVWSVPREDPTALRAFLPSGDVVDVPDAWSDATSIVAMALSRDGARLAAITATGGRTLVSVAGVVRDPDGVPVGLGTPLQLAVVGGSGVGITWIDELSVGVLGRGDGQSIVVEQLVGGPTATSSAPADMASIAGGNGISSLRLRAEDGTLYVKRGTSWQATAAGIQVLATEQGEPQ